MSEKQETVEVTMKLPKAIVDFLKDAERDVAKYIEKNVVGCVMSDLECDFLHIPKVEEVIRKYGLKPVFKEFGVLPGYYNNH